MKPEVDNSVQEQGWPPDQWHPDYASFVEWLDRESPVHDERLNSPPRRRRRWWKR